MNGAIKPKPKCDFCEQPSSIGFLCELHFLNLPAERREDLSVSYKEKVDIDSKFFAAMNRARRSLKELGHERRPSSK